MAKNKSTVYLGYEDEEVNEKHKNALNYSVNKIGGIPDWPGSEIKIFNCPICGLARPLILQIYAPLENSQFHRTLYVFGCLNSSCSNQSKSWICIRTQNLDQAQDMEVVKAAKPAAKITWCSGADDWDLDVDEKENEENGNVVIANDNSRVSDDEEESNSMENEIIANFGNMQMGDDKNANCGAQGGGIGATGTVVVPTVFAEIEGEESEMVSVETPLAPERDLIALLKQTQGISSNVTSLTLNSFFIAVDEEQAESAVNYQGISDHARELYVEYQKRDDSSHSPVSPVNQGCVSSANGEGDQESYEKAVPAHGDVMFHNFVSSIQSNPGQIIRYSRDAYPLLIAPLTEPAPKCQNCGGETICEVQILPTLIPRLRLENSDPAPIEYGNVLVFTCLKSCWDTPDKMRLESIIVQQEC